MLYAHSFSPIEQSIYRRLSLTESISQFDVNAITTKMHVDRLKHFNEHKVLLYSYLQLDYYKHLDTFQLELDRVELLISYIKEVGFDKIILLSYPGAYSNSDNLFLQHKGLIEQMFISSGIQTVTLKVQAIYDTYKDINSFHALFYDKAEHQYCIPKKSNAMIYSVSMKNMVEVILKSIQYSSTTCFDVFDQVSELSVFLSNHSDGIDMNRLAPVYLYVKSYLGQYSSPTMLELFLRPIVPMHNYRTEKELNITLEDEGQIRIMHSNFDRVAQVQRVYGHM
jgi:hypothetical protein